MKPARARHSSKFSPFLMSTTPTLAGPREKWETKTDQSRTGNRLLAERTSFIPPPTGTLGTAD